MDIYVYIYIYIYIYMSTHLGCLKSDFYFFLFGGGVKNNKTRKTNSQEICFSVKNVNPKASLGKMKVRVADGIGKNIRNRIINQKDLENERRDTLHAVTQRDTTPR